MNKTAIKKFAVDARNELIKKVAQKATEYGIQERKILELSNNSINGKILEYKEIIQRKALIKKINSEGYNEVIEEVAYTWFNRFIALRFMEVNGYLPSRIKIFTNGNNEFRPEIISQAVYLDFGSLDKSKIIELKETNKEDELFKYLLIAQCNELNKILPGMFQRISDYTELLFPDNLLRLESVIDRMIKDIPEEDWNEQVQIIGWLYQYYNSEPKDKVINIYKGNVEKKDIPAATQIFTPDWIVRYLVDNSLGRYWMERNPHSKLKEKLEYFVPSKSGELKYIDEIIKPEELKVYDPSVGSGHFPVYAFDVLIEIYRETGYTDNDAVESILKNNLFGLDIDERAYQLAYFSIMMKARQYSRRIFSKGIEPNIYAFIDSDEINRDILGFVNTELSVQENKQATFQLVSLLDEFNDSKNLGSILNLSKYNYDLLYKFINSLLNQTNNLNFFGYEADLEKINEIISISKILTGKYHVVVTNPPYLNRMNPKLKKYVNDNYKDYKTDLFSVFIYKGFDNLIEDGYSGYMTPMVWMFIKSYENLRNYIINYKDITTLIHFEYSAFEEATVPLCSVVFSGNSNGYEGAYFRLTEFKGGMDVQREKVLKARDSESNYLIYNNLNKLKNIPGNPIAYWASINSIKSFKNKIIDEYYFIKLGISPGDTNKFLKFWYEVSLERINFDAKSRENTQQRRKIWYPCNKGGSFRKWYGNKLYVINWDNDGFELRNFRDKNGRLISRPQNLDFQLKEHIGYSRITSSDTSYRIYESGNFFTDSSAGVFGEHINYILGYLNSEPSKYFIKFLNPTLNYQAGDVARLPITYNLIENVETDVKNMINISKTDWDLYETSWEFSSHPLVNNYKISESLREFVAFTDAQFNKLKKLEENNNKRFIQMFGLEQELSYEIKDKDISITRISYDNKHLKDNDNMNKYLYSKSDVIVSFISYFVGCYFGRYSLDKKGLIFAGGQFVFDNYKKFPANKDGIIPITENQHFEDDIVEKFVEFIEVVYGKDTLEENLQFISDALGSKGLARDVIRQYFIKEFYKDHCKSYQNRPIYWLFDSGKKNAFKALIYLHRYEKDTIAKLRTDYIHKYQDKYKALIEELESRINTASISEKVKLNKEMKNLKDKEEELKVYEEKIHYLADQMIKIDLDDGVEYNYGLFKDVLSKRK